MENVGVEQQSMKFLLNPVWISEADLGAMLQLKDDLKKYKHTLSLSLRSLGGYPIFTDDPLLPPALD